MSSCNMENNPYCILILSRNLLDVILISPTLSYANSTELTLVSGMKMQFFFYLSLNAFHLKGQFDMIIININKCSRPQKAVDFVRF